MPSVGSPDAEMLVFYQQDTLWRARAGGDYETEVELVPPRDPEVVESMDDETAFSRAATFFRRREDGTYGALETIRDWDWKSSPRADGSRFSCAIRPPMSLRPAHVRSSGRLARGSETTRY